MILKATYASAETAINCNQPYKMYGRHNIKLIMGWGTGPAGYAPVFEK